MFSKVIRFFDRSKDHKNFECFSKSKNYDKKSMEWQDEDDDRRSMDSSFWSGRNILEKSKSDSSIIAIGDCNYRTQGVQVSIEACNTPKNVTSALRNLNLNNDDEIEENDTKFIPIATKDSHSYDRFDYGLLKYGFKTEDVTTKQLVIQRPEILNFQGNIHSSEEIAPYWKKDCRTWLWKSVRFANHQNEIKAAAAILQS